MTENKFNPDAAKRLYEEATSIGTSKVSENDFYNSLNDSEYARIVYNRYKDKYGVNLLGAEDDSSFLSTLGYNVPYAGNKTKEQEPKFSLKRPEEPKKENKVETPESFNTRIPNIQTVKDDVTGEDVSVDMDIPKTPDMTVKMPNSLDRFKQSPLGESNLSKRIFGVDSILEQESPQEKAWKEVYNSAPEAMANLGKDEVEEIYDANGEIIGEKVIRTANEADLDRIHQIQQGIRDQYDAIDKAEGEFIKQYEEYLQRSGANNVNIHGDSWNLVNPWDRRKSKQEMEFIRNNAARYNRIMSAKKALNLQSKFAQTYADLAEYDRSVEKGEQMSAMVSSGEITEDAMKILRATKSPEVSRQYIERQVKNGTMSRETANKLLKMGDLSEKNAFGYGFTHPGYAEDFLTFGMSEIKRNFDIKSINDRLKSGKEVSDDEKNALLMYSKMSDMMSEAKMDKRGWMFEAGQGLPKTLQFIAEIGITGGASAVGKGFTRKMILESIKKYGFWKAGAKMAKETGGRLVKNAWQQAIFSPITPSSYVDFSNRVLNMSFEQENISWQDRIDALYKSYAQTWAGRFSETLDNVLLDMPVGSWLYGSKYMKPVLQPAAWIAKKMEGMPWSKQTSNLLERFGIDGMHKEILTEMADPVLQSVVTGDTEELKKMWENKEDFAKTVALHSAILGGFHGAMGYGVGAATAAIESQRVSKAYDDAMNKINKLTFVDKQLNDLKDELVASISTDNYVAQEGKNNGRTVGEILSDMDKRMQYYATTDKGTAAYESDKRVFDIADYASRVGAFKYGASQNIKDQIARRMGVAKDENGNAIPMEFEHTDGNVYEFTDVDGKQYFILDNSDSAVVLMDRATGEKVIKNKSVYDAGTITQTNGNDWAMNNYLLNVENWKAQDAQSQNQQAQQPGTTVPPTQAMLRGVPVPITNFDAQTGEVTVTDQTGEELTLPVNTPNLELVYPTQQTEQAPVQPEETLQPTMEENVTAEEPVAPTEEAVEAEMQEPAYVAPRGEDNDIVWNEVPAERFKQVIDEEVGSDYADGYIDMRIEDAQRKLNEHNEKQKPIASGEYKAFMEESKKLESNLAYWTNAKQEYANAVAQEVAAQNEVETPAQEEANEVAPESTVMYDAKQPEQVEAEAPVQVSKEELDANVTGWKSNGINVNVVNSIDEVTNEQVLADMKKGVKVTGWYDTKTGEVYVFAPNITDTAELDSTVIHEVVAHKGLRGLIGEKYYEQFCEKVFDSMPKELQDKYMAYPGVNGRKAAAADEYIAYLAEKEDLTADEQKIWDRIIQFFRDWFDARLVGILKKDTITDADISKLIRMSYANIKNNAQQEADTTVESQSQNEEVADNGVVFENDTNGQAMYSIKTYREGGRDNLVNFAQKQVESNKLTQEQAEEIVSEMDSIYDMIQQYKDVYQPFGAWSEAEVKVDDNGKAVFSVVKPNGEYDMNLDFSLVCKKRRTLDSVFDEMIKRGIISEFELGQVDVAKINEIIREFGFETACRLCFVDAKRFRVAQVADQFCAKYNEIVVMNDKQLKQVIKTEEKNSVRKKIAKHLLEHPEDKVILSRDNFMSANGFENIKVNKAAVMSLYNQAKGTGGPKASFGDVQYLNEIADSSWTPEKAYAVGGVRLQSFSDYVPRMVFDYIQMVADLAAKKLPVHSYTKESTFAKQFGLTGIKINMSLVPRVDADGVAPGLDKDGNYAWQEGETFPFDEAIAIQNAEGYKDSCGTIAVGISDEHILKMLDDENIRMIIPYHKSGLNKEVAKFNNIDQFVDYTNSQNTRYADGKKLNKADSKKHFNFNEDLHKNNDPRGAAQRYLEWCDKKGYIPKFEQFRNHPNYYKLLEDFTTVVTENGVDTVVPQKAVEMKFPKETDAFGSLETLIQQGLEEDAVLEGRRSEKIGEIVDKIEETLPKNNPTDPNDGPRYRTSAEIDKEYPNWLEGTTNESGKHSTQVTKTVGTYNKVGEWIENNLGKDVEILDASSGMGLGTQSLREKGFNIEDVEPYQSEDRKQNNPATYSAYADINKQYDYIISNAVLNVIPDDWRADVLHNMAERMKDGGKMFINTRKAGEEKSIKDKIELDTPQEVLVKRNGKIASYQKFFTPQELKSWVEQELGDGYTVEVANEKNSGTKGLAAVVVTKNSDIRYRTAQPSFTDEENAIIEKAKEDGTYLKAPNGKDTNLTPKQWAQVRTNAFKEWFGDWEMWFKKNFLLNGDIVSSLSGNEFERVDGKTLTEQVAEYFESIGGKAMSPIYGEVILDEKGAEDSLSHGIGRNKAIAYAAVKDVIENGVLIDYDKNHKGRDYDSALIAAPITIGGERYICEVVITRKQDNRFYLHEVTSVKKLQDAVSLTNSGQSPTAHQGVIAKVLQNIISASDNVSKVVDENGEPKVVYHGSVSEDIEAFDKNKINANETDAYYNGFWFSTDSETSPAWRTAKKVYPVFLNLRNPITRKQAHKIAREYFKDEEFDDSIGSEGIRSGADAVRAKLQQLGYDGVIDFAHPKINVQEFKETGQTTFETSGGTKYVIMQESDGVNVYEYDYYSDDHIGEFNTSVDTIEEFFNDAYFFGDETFVVFEPNQIKSAIENIGTFSKENDDIRYRIPSTPAEARQRAENIMKDAIAPMATELGVEVNYVTNEDISDVEPGARKKRQSKGWYQDGKVYINLSTHETIDDARETYLHEVVGHYGLRGLLKDQFKPVMQKVFASLTPTQQKNLLEIFADEVEAAEEFLSSMAENDIDPTIVEKVIGFIREALRSMGINLDNYTDADLQYLLWRSKNSLKENAGNIETARWEAKAAEVRYRTFKNGRLSASSKYGAIDKRIEELKDTAWSVKLLQDEIIARGGIIDDTSDPYGQSTLMPQRSSHEINLFNERVYKPMLRSFSKAAKSLSRSLGISRFEANERLEDYLYARHAIERNKKLAIDKMVRKASESFADLSTAQRAQLVEIATEMYEDEYTGGNNGITTKSAFSYSEQAAIRQSINEWISENKEVNESGLTDKEAQDIIDEIYTNQNVEVQSEIIRLSDGISNCTEFILDTWLKYGIISKADHNTYLNQYRHYVPLRGWTEKSDIDYDEVAGNAYNRGETLISLNRRAKGRTSKADSPLAYISQMATSAIIYGNKNLMKEMAFNMVKNNYDLIKDLAFIEDKGVLTHKTNQEVKAHEVQLKVNGRTTRFSFREDFEVGVAAATAIKGENVQNIKSSIVRGIGAVTRMQSRLRTSWNPVFMTVNAVRDLMFGNLAFPIKYGFGNNLKLNKNYCIGFAAAFFDAAGIPVGSSKWRQEYEAYKREGGQTGYVHMDDIKRLKRETSKILRRYQNGLGFVPQDIFKLISYVLRVMGEPAENAMRFATFKTLKDSGISERQAAMASKEITVNFNRTGAKKWPGMFYGFFNATLEGTANYFRMGFNKETAKRFWMVNAALAALSYTLSWWAKGFGGDDDDELMAGMSPEELAEYKQMKEFTNEYNRISDYVKHTNILLPILGDGENGQRFMAIPVAQSFRMASALGITLFDMINNDQKVGDELREFAWFVMGEIQPFDVENVSLEGEGLIGNVGRAISPTPILPFVEVYQNRNFMGLPIYKESFINEELQERIEPSYTIAGRNTPEFLIGNAKELNEKLGGNEYISAKEYERFAQNRLDAHGWDYTLAKMADALSDPASVDHVLQGLFGGFYELGAGAVERYASDDETSVNDWVLAKRFVKEATMKPGAESYHERREYADYVKRAMKNEMSHIQTGEGNAYLNEDPYCNELVEINEIWRKNIKELTDAISMCKMGGNTNKADIERLEAIRDELVLQAALEFEKLERRYNK